MKLYQKSVLSVALFSLFAFGSHQSLAATSVTGTVAVTLNLIDSCLINDGEIVDGSQFGSLNFGNQSSLFTEATAITTATGGGSGITITCNTSSGTAPTITLVSGVNDASATATYNHALKNGTSYINYNLYKDSGYSEVIALNEPFFTSANNGTPETVNLYGKAVRGNTQTNLATGLYTDTITLKVDF